MLDAIEMQRKGGFYRRIQVSGEGADQRSHSSSIGCRRKVARPDIRANQLIAL